MGRRQHTAWAVASAVVWGGYAGGAAALDFELGDAEFSLKNRLSVGGYWRLQQRSSKLIAKLNLPGQQDLCPDDCISFTGDPEPNQRLVDADGAFTGILQDDGNLNYDQGDLVTAAAILSTDLNIFVDDYTFKFSTAAYYDPTNLDFDETHPDTTYQPRHTERAGEARDLLGLGIDLQDAFIASYFELGEDAKEYNWSLGYQRIRWGESTLVALGSLSEINPPDARRLRQPGASIAAVFQPVPVATLATQLSDSVSGELIYQFKHVPTIVDPAGSFFADNDLLNGGRFFTVGLGQFHEDPDRQHRVDGLVGVISHTSATINYLPVREPSDQGQAGVRINWYAADLNGGTEFGFYALNYHARLPNISFNAAQDSCSRDGEPGNVASAFAACNGFKSNPDEGLEPLPIETMDAFVEYPEDIQLYGISFNTNVGSWSLAGEFAYRPNMPVQVHLADLVFAALEPAFPEEDYVLDQQLAADLATTLLTNPDLATPGNAQSLAAIGQAIANDPGTYTLPSADNGIPNFVSTYRGLDRYQGGAYIPGYERLQVGQIDFTAIKAFGNTANPFGADQILLILEAGATMVYDMPSRDVLQFDGGHPVRTHASPGADGTGTESGDPDARRLNPTQQTGGFADDFAWGYRMIARGEYNDIWQFSSIKPQLIWTHDVDGIAPLPAQNFVEGNRSWVLAFDFELGQAFNFQTFWQGFTGGRYNTRKDRDVAGFVAAYNF